MARFFAQIDDLDSVSFANWDTIDLELGRILRDLAERVEEGDRAGVLRDSSGTPVGRYRMEG